MTDLVSTTAMILAVCVLGVLGSPVTTYQDAMVVSLPWLPYGAAFQFSGVIVVSEHEVIPHEYGHYLQQKEYGASRYLATVAIPSLISAAIAPGAHMSLPWESEASALGGYVSPEERMAEDLERILAGLEDS